MAISYRDIKLKSDKKLDKKQDKRQQFRAVITDSFGNQSGAGDIWFSRTQRKVWAMKVGGTQPYPYYCYRIKPAIGVGVIIGYSSPLNQLPEVLQTDTEFLGPSNTTGTAYESPDNEDFLPGGRLQLWLDTRLIQSLAIYPDATGLFVNVTNGDYIYGGERKTFDGEENIDLSASQPGAGLHRYVGLYLDSSNLLQTVDGATVVLASTPAQPTWPDGSYRLGMVRINATQTSFSMADDIVNLKIPWTDEESFGTGVWPADGEIKINDTLYTTLALAIAAAVSGDIIRLGSGTFTCNNLTLPNGVSLIGSDMTLTILSQTADANCLTTGTTGDVSNLKISMLINSANDRVALVLLGDNFIENVYITGDNDGAGKVDGVSSTSSNDPVLTDCIVGVGSGGYAVVVNNVNTIVTLNMGNYFGGTGSILVTNGLCKLIYPQLQSAPTAYPATQGIWFDAGGTPQTQLQGKAVWFNSSTTSPLNVTPRATAPSSPVASDAYIDDGTNTGSGTPAWREYISGAWRTLTLADMVTTAGDIIYATAAKTVARLGIGLDGTFLKVVTGLPAWTALAASDIASGVLAIARGGTNSGTALNNNRVMQSSAGAIVEAAAITAARALVSDANGIPVAATTTTTEINFVNGVTSAIQTQLDARIAKAFLDAKGDLISASANDTPAILSVGSDGQRPEADSAQTTGIKWSWPSFLTAADGSPNPALSADNAGDLTAVGNVTMADDKFIGLGSAAGRIVFDDQATDEVNIMDANVGIGTATPAYKVDVSGEVVSRQFLTSRVSGLADDTATNFSPVTVGNRFWFFFVTNGGEYFLGVDTFNGITTVSQSGCAVVAGGGTLTGTTGPDGTINLRDDAGTLYVENRRGSARNLGVMFGGSD